MALPVASTEYVRENLGMAIGGQVVCAREDLLVRRSPTFPDGEEAGRVGPGVGCVVHPNGGLQNIHVEWPESGDKTIWTRAGEHGFDVVVAAPVVAAAATTATAGPHR